MSNFINIFIIYIFLSGCMPNGKSSRDYCKEGDGYSVQGRKDARDLTCGSTILLKGLNRNENTINQFFTACLLSQEYLNRCDERKTLKTGISTW
ncbi:hypothetical protein CH359_19345 [Leptospira meyeri]|nr:hypothetical protein CH359_19345 [Leptospira meyeri]PJZ95012.1 hypothetical protein CH358_19370 [Leptospira meyeri]